MKKDEPKKIEENINIPNDNYIEYKQVVKKRQRAGSC
jgi:hypothetical protein